MTTIVLVDDHPIVRQGLRTLLETEVGFQVIGEAGDGLSAVQLVERLRSQVLIVDVLMPGVSGLEVTRQVRQRIPQTQVIVLSMHANEAYVLEALRNGAAGYVLKDAKTMDLVQAVRAVASGRRYLSPPCRSGPSRPMYTKRRPPSLGPMRALPVASGKCSTWPPPAIPAPRSPSGCSSARARWKLTAPISCASWACITSPN